MDALGLQPLRARDVVVIVRVATINHHIVFVEMRDDLVEDGVDNRRREHQADGARLGDLADELLERRRTGGAILDERRNRIS